MTSYEIGRLGEEIAVRFLMERGYEILRRNTRIVRREIDIIAKREELIIFVEVKARSDEQYGSGAESIDRRKQRRMIEAARMYSTESALVRFDVISILVDPNRKIALKIQHIRNAFA